MVEYKWDQINMCGCRHAVKENYFFDRTVKRLKTILWKSHLHGYDFHDFVIVERHGVSYNGSCTSLLYTETLHNLYRYDPFKPLIPIHLFVLT